MNDDQLQPNDDAAFQRLQAADPARGSSPDLSSVYASVSAATGVPVAEETILVDELSARRARRTPMWLQAAAVVAGIAVIGGGSYALGGANAENPPTAAPAMTLGDASRGGGAVAPESASNLASADAKLAGWGFGRTVFTSKGLSTEGGSAPAYGFDAEATFTQETIARAAAALGVAGEPRQAYGSWVVGTNDGSGATVSISSDGMTSISYYDPTRDPWSCLKVSIDPVLPPAGGGTVEGSTGASEPAVSPECQTSADPAPAGDAAVGLAKDAMSALGVDPAGFELEATTDPGSAQYTSVSAYQVIDGQRTGAAWLSVVATGVQSLYGSLAPTVALGDYDVVSPTEAVARLTDPRFGPSYGGVMPLAAQARDAAGATAEIAPDGPTDQPTVPATPDAGSPLAWPVEHVTIVSARLGLALTTLPTGASVLVPTYELSDADGAVWTVIAVADGELDFDA